jgi:tetratricopeptide (TPR) repeat protein
LAIFPIFYIPLVVFTGAHDQFELPKITFLTLTAVLMALFLLKKLPHKIPSPLSIALIVFFTTQIVASLPSTSLSWRTSLLGDYENFCGLTTLFVIFVLFLFYNRFLNIPLFKKLVFFNSLAALLSSIYALAQHFGWDLIAWNPGSVNPSREFGALGNPNFLSGYLAMSLPLYLGWCKKEKDQNDPEGEWDLLVWLGTITGFSILFATTPIIGEHLGISWPGPTLFIVRTLGLALFSLGLSAILRRRAPWVLVCGFGLILLGLVSTESRGGFLAVLAGMFIWIFLTLKDPENLQKMRAWISQRPLVPGIALILFFILIIGIGHGFLTRLFQSIQSIHQSFADSRLPIWNAAWKMALAHPLTGVGLDTFKIAFPAYSGTDFNHTDGLFVSSRMAHDQWLQLASTTGFLGVSAYLLVLVAWVWMGFRLFRSGTPEDKVWLSAVLACEAAYQVQALFSFDVAALDLLWILCLGFVQNQYRKGFEIPEKPKSLVGRVSLIEKSFLGLFVLVGLYFPLTRLGADLAFSRSSIASTLLNQLPRSTELSTALAYSDYEIALSKRAAILCPLETKYRLYLGLAYEQRAQLDPTLRQGHLLLALEQYQETLRMSPSYSYYYNNLGRVQTSLGAFNEKAYEEAEKAYGKTCSLDPINPLFRLNWTDALKKIGKDDEAQHQEEKAFELDPLFTAKFQAQKALDLYRQGDHKGAFALLEGTEKKAPQSPETWFCEGVLKLSDGKKKEALAALERTKDLGPTPEKNPTIKDLDQLIEQARN